MHSLNLITGLLMVLGLILTGVGRWMLIHEASEVSFWWALALRCLPLADVMFLSRFWDTAKNGAMVSIAGLVLLLPWGAKELYEQKQAQREHADIPSMSNDTKSGLYESMLWNHRACIELKDKKFQELNARMTEWYRSLEARRVSLASPGTTPEQLAAFNAEAAAYKALRDVSKKEADELAALRAKPFEFRDIKNEDYAAWIETVSKMETTSPGSRGAVAGRRSSALMRD